MSRTSDVRVNLKEDGRRNLIRDSVLYASLFYLFLARDRGSGKDAGWLPGWWTSAKEPAERVSRRLRPGAHRKPAMNTNMRGTTSRRFSPSFPDARPLSSQCIKGVHDDQVDGL